MSLQPECLYSNAIAALSSNPADLQAWLWFSILCCGVCLAALVHFVRRALKAEKDVRFRDRVQQIAPIAVCIINLDTGRLFYANDCAPALLGIPESWDQFAFPSLFKKDDYEALLKTLESEGKYLPQRILLRTPAKGEIWTSLSATRYNQSGQNCAKILIIDINKAEGLHEEMAKAKMRLENLIQSSPDGIVLVDTKGVIRFISNSCYQFKTQNIPRPKLGESIYSATPEGVHSEVKAMIERICAGSGEQGSVTRSLQPDGTPLWMEVRGAMVKDPFSDQSMIFLTLRNASRRMEAEAKVKEHAVELETALARIAKLQKDVLSICAWTKQVHVDGKWISVDAYLGEHLGLPLTHGISDEGIALLEKESGLSLKPLPKAEEG